MKQLKVLMVVLYVLLYATVNPVSALPEQNNAYVTDVNPYEAMIDPDTLPLEFQFVKLDTPVAFLATPEDIVEQTRAVRTRKVATTTAFEDGVISMTVHIAPGLVERENLSLSFCLDVDEQLCEMLPVWNSEEQNFADSLIINNIYTDVETSVYLELLIPEMLVAHLRSQLNDGPRTYTIRASVSDSENVNSLGVELAQVTLVDLPETATRTRSSSKNIGMKYGKTFSKGFSNDKFGLDFEIGGEGNVYMRDKNSTTGGSLDEETLEYDIEGNPLSASPTTATNQDPKKPPDNVGGVKLQASAGLYPILFGDSFNLAGIKSWINKETGSPLYMDVSLKMLDSELFGKGWEYKKSGSSDKSKSGGRYQLKSATRRDDPTENVTFIDISDGGGFGMEEISIAFDLTQLGVSKEKSVENTQTFVVVIIPIEVTGSLTGSIKLGGEVGLKYASSELSVYGEGIGPEMSIAVSIEAGVSLVIVSVGFGGELTLLADKAGLNAELNLTRLIKGEGGFFNGSITNTLTGPFGRFYLWVKYVVPRFGIPPWKKKKKELTLVSWNGFEKSYTLLAWSAPSQDTTERSMDDYDAEYGGSETPYYILNEQDTIDFNTWKPTDGQRWICLYDSAEARGSGLCLPLEDLAAKEGGVALKLSELKFSNGKSVNAGGLLSLKLFGTRDKGLEATLYEGDNYSGSRATWVAYGEELYNLNQVGYGNLLDKAGSIVLRAAKTKAENGENKEKKWCVYENTDFQGQEYCHEETRNLTSLGHWSKDEISSLKIYGDIDVSFINSRGDFARWVLSSGEWAEWPNLDTLNDQIDMIQVGGSNEPKYRSDFVTQRVFETVCPYGASTCSSDQNIEWEDSYRFCDLGAFVNGVATALRSEGIALACVIPPSFDIDFPKESVPAERWSTTHHGYYHQHYDIDVMNAFYGNNYKVLQFKTNFPDDHMNNTIWWTFHFKQIVTNWERNIPNYEAPFAHCEDSVMTDFLMPIFPEFNNYQNKFIRTINSVSVAKAICASGQWINVRTDVWIEEIIGSNVSSSAEDYIFLTCPNKTAICGFKVEKPLRGPMSGLGLACCLRE